MNSIPGPLTHLDETGAARMVDVSGKDPTVRRAVATGVLRTTDEVVRLLRAERLPKGDALATARIAGIMGAKRTPDLVPLCHPIALTGVTVDLETAGAEVRITATVRTTDRTGVEMEALTAVAVVRTSVPAVSRSTVTPVSAMGWHSGTRSGVRLAPMIPAIRAVASASPLGNCSARSNRTTSSVVRSTPVATARRTPGSLPDTSTIRAAPEASRWVSGPAFDVTSRS